MGAQTADLDRRQVSGAAGIDLEQLRVFATQALDRGQPVADDDDLLELGMDSLAVMRLAVRCQQAGAPVTFADLVEWRTVGEWWRLVSARQEGVATAVEPPPDGGAPDLVDGEPFPLAAMQHAYWVGRADGQPAGGVGAHFYCELDGPVVDAGRLERAVRFLLCRHGMLRARFLPDGRQQILPDSPWPGLRVTDLRAEPRERLDARLEHLRDELSHRRLAVERAEVFDVRLTLLPGGRSRTHVQIEMLVADAHSFRVLLADLARAYHEPDATPAPLGITFPGYLAARERLRRQAGTAARDYWLDRVPDLPGPPRLPLARDPSGISGHRVVRHHHWLTPEESGRLTAQARRYGLTMPVVFATAFARVLDAWSEEPHFLLNLPLYDRQPVHPDVAWLVGDFTNLLLLEVACTGGSFANDARLLQDRLRADLAHTGFAGVDLLRALARSRRDAGALAPVVFTSAVGLGELFGTEARAALGEPVWTMSQTPQVWLDHQVTERDGGSYLNWDAVDGLFAEGVLAAMFDAYVDLVGQLLTRDWAEVPPVPAPAAHLAVRASVNATDGPAARRTLHGPFFAAAAATPDRPALAGADGTVTYGELADRALRLAGALRERGVVPGTPVAVTLPKGAGQVTAVLGILAAGGTYVPVGVDQPATRRERIHHAARAWVAVTDRDHRDRLDWPAGVTPLVLAGTAATAPLDRDPVDDPDAVAYVLFTSGSTGEPKGVMVRHTNAVNTIDAINDRYGVGAADRVLAVSALDFDLSVYDMFGMFAAGGAAVLIDEPQRRDAAAWARLVRAHAVTIWQSVPALLDMLLVTAEQDGAGLPSLRLALLGGDWVGADLPDRLARQAPGGRLVALGGTTETALHSTAFEAAAGVAWPGAALPYGTPLRNQRCRVVDAHGRDRPDWVPGELWIGGASVAVGYQGDAERTARQFVDHAGLRWYRTGDRARYRPDGTLELLGRADFQVKLNGHRIELGEVEAALAGQAGVAAAVVVLAGGRLVGMVVPGAGRTVDEDGLLAQAAAVLPPYMVPSRVVVLDALPLSRNGKVDRAALTAKAGAELAGRTGSGGAPPRGPVETAVAAIWADLLGGATAGRTDSFFALGGDSLLATRMMFRLRAAGLHCADLTQLFRTPGLADFAATLAVGAPVTMPVLTADPAHRHEPFPATDVQRAYWLGRLDDLELGGVGSHWYWEFDGVDVDLDRLSAALRRLVDRHEMLRAVFDTDGNQRILPAVEPFQIRVTAADGDGAAQLRRMRDELSHRRTDPHRWPLTEVRAVRYGARRTRLAFSFDYIVLDALSIVTVFVELSRLYLDPDAVLSTVDVSFRDYVLRGGPDRAAVDQSKAYWTARLDELPPSPALPLAKNPAQIVRPRFTRREARLTPAEWTRLQARATRYQVTPAATLAAAYAEVLSRWSGQPDLTVNVTLFNRRDVHPDINHILGDFTSLLLVDHRAASDLLAAVRGLQERMWSGMAHGAVSAIWVMRELSRRRGGEPVTMPVVFTSALGLSEEVANLSFPFGEQVWGVSQTPQVWLDNQVMERGGGLVVSWDAVEELFPAGLLDDMLDAYLRLLRWLADAQWSDPAPDLLPPAQRRVRAAVNATAGPTSDGLLHDGFFGRAADRREAVAVCAGAARVTYGDLAGRALRLGAALRDRGLAPGEPVAVSAPKGVDQVAAVLGVLAAGGCYVPVSAAQPVARRATICRTAGVRLALVAADDDGWGSVPVLTVADAVGTAPLDEPVEVGPDELAYVIYTSGSTGEPKGVEITHRSALNTITDVNDRWAVGSGDRILGVSALDFDLSVYDIFGPLSVGGALVLVDDEDRQEARQLVAAVRDHGVTIWNSVPALLDMALVGAGGDGLPSLRLALVSGDWVGTDLAARFAAAAPGARLVALGGATEASIWSNAFEVTVPLPAHWRAVPYGFPLRNQRFAVVDPSGRDCPDHVTGELWIGGLGVARGYRGDPARTAAQFVPRDGGRWYRTGDLGRYWPDGTLEFLGRADTQVKVRGHRIELGEVEAALLACPGVARAVAVAVGERPAVRLGAAVVGTAGAVEVPRLRALVADRLPAYMVPETVRVVPELPLSANGKVDRAAVARLLGAPDPGDGAGAPPDSEAERIVARVWARLLGVADVRREHSFLALGGDSLLATRFLEEIRRDYGVELSLRQLFGAPTVAEVASWLASAGSGAGQLDEGEI